MKTNKYLFVFFVFLVYRCVSESDCHDQFYLQYQQSDYCLHLDTDMPDIVSCHLCCQGNGCNNATAPPLSSLYTPPVSMTSSTTVAPGAPEVVTSTQEIVTSTPEVVTSTQEAVTSTEESSSSTTTDYVTLF